MNNIKVSIICNAYNQATYIEEALESFLMQETDFAFEVLVHDDASTDGTAEIIKQYAANFPQIIKPLYEEVNQYTPGGKHNFQVQAARVQGDYIAVCEGDDYWTDPQKLQLQYEALESHPDIDICVHAGMRVDALSKKPRGIVAPKSEECIIPIEDVIEGGGAYVVTNSIFMRSEAYKNPPQSVVDFHLDYMIQIAASLRGGMYYINKCMSAYRIAAQNSWSSAMQQSPTKYAAHLLRLINAMEELDRDINKSITAPLQKHIDWLQFEYNIYMGNFQKALSTNYWKTLPRMRRLSTWPRMILNRALYKKDKATLHE